VYSQNPISSGTGDALDVEVPFAPGSYPSGLLS